MFSLTGVRVASPSATVAQVAVESARQMHALPGCQQSGLRDAGAWRQMQLRRIRAVSPIGTQVSATFGNWSIISMEVVAVPGGTSGLVGSFSKKLPACLA